MNTTNTTTVAPNVVAASIPNDNKTTTVPANVVSAPSLAAAAIAAVTQGQAAPESPAAKESHVAHEIADALLDGDELDDEIPPPRANPKRSSSGPNAGRGKPAQNAGRKNAFDHRNTEIRVAVPELRRNPSIGRLIMNLSRWHKEENCAHIGLRFIENQNESDDDYASGYVRIVSDDLGAIEYMSKVVHIEIDNLMRNEQRQFVTRTNHRGNRNRSADQKSRQNNQNDRAPRSSAGSSSSTEDRPSRQQNQDRRSQPGAPQRNLPIKPRTQNPKSAPAAAAPAASSHANQGSWADQTDDE